MRQEIVGQQVLKEFLREILRVGAAMAVSLDKSIKRRPIRAAELLHRFGRLQRITSLGCQHHAPMSSGEPARPALVLVWRPWPGSRVLFLWDHTALCLPYSHQLLTKSRGLKLAVLKA